MAESGRVSLMRQGRRTAGPGSDFFSRAGARLRGAPTRYRRTRWTPEICWKKAGFYRVAGWKLR